MLRPGAASVGADLEAVGVCGAVPVPPVALKLQHVDARQGLESLPELFISEVASPTQGKVICESISLPTLSTRLFLLMSLLLLLRRRRLLLLHLLLFVEICEIECICRSFSFFSSSLGCRRLKHYNALITCV